MVLRLLCIFFLISTTWITTIDSFATIQRSNSNNIHSSSSCPKVAIPSGLSKIALLQRLTRKTSSTSTSLFVLLEVPDGFFTVTFPVLGILLSISKSYGRVRMEERAWEQRLEDARILALRNDPTLTELDLRRKEAEMEWSAYGTKGASLQNTQNQPQEREEIRQTTKRQRRGGVTVMNRDNNNDSYYENVATTSNSETVKSNEDVSYKMEEDEIKAFEKLYGIEYDPYYDEPYTEDELPTGKYTVDRMYGDRIYENGEIFYKDYSTLDSSSSLPKKNLYWRQGSKPRNGSKFRFWG